MNDFGSGQIRGSVIISEIQVLIKAWKISFVSMQSGRNGLTPAGISWLLKMVSSGAILGSPLKSQLASSTKEC
jgi:hypothetical protein